MFTEAFTFVFDERSAVFCWLLGCWAVVDPLFVGDCAWLAPDAGGLALCVVVLEGELVCAWLEGVWFDGWLVWA
jgi:hypothetical protein